MNELPAPIGAKVSVRLDGELLGPWRLSSERAVTIGRDSASGIRLHPGWAPRNLATLSPIEGGWILTNGMRTRLRATSRWVDAKFMQGASVMLQRGDWEIDWPELDFECSLSIAISSRTIEAPVARDLKGKPSRQCLGTDIAGYELPIDPKLKHRLAVLFEHVILDGRPPPNQFKAAAKTLNMEEDTLKKAVTRLRHRLNHLRGVELETIEQLGFYLVHVAGAIDEDDLQA